MTLEEQRVAIGKFFGYDMRYNHVDLKNSCNNHQLLSFNERGIPDWPNDLNVVHRDLESTISNFGEVEVYTSFLRKIYAESSLDIEYSNDLPLVRCTASQKTEAFLKTLDLWKE